jgi:hypothetical protein
MTVAYGIGLPVKNERKKTGVANTPEKGGKRKKL